MATIRELAEEHWQGRGDLVYAHHPVAQLKNDDGKVYGSAGFGPPTLVYNWIDDEQLRTGVLTEGRGPETDGEIALDFDSADGLGVELGDTVTIATTQSGTETYELGKYNNAIQHYRQYLREKPDDAEVLARCEPVYEEYPGWETSTEQITRWEDLPVNCRHYLLSIAQMTGARLTIASVGPAPEQTMFI